MNIKIVFNYQKGYIINISEIMSIFGAKLFKQIGFRLVRPAPVCDFAKFTNQNSKIEIWHSATRKNQKNF